MTATKKTSSPFLKIALGISVSLLFIWLALRQIDFAKLGQILLHVNLFWVCMAAVLALVAYYVRSLLWQQLLIRHARTNSWNLFRIVTIGYFANNILPLKIGELVRAWLLGKQENLSSSLAIGTVVLERGTDIFALLFYFCAIMFFVPFEHWLKLSGLIMVGIAGSFLIVLLLNYRFGGHLLDAIEKPLKKLPGEVGDWLHVQIGKFLEGLKLLQSAGQVGKIVGLSLLTWMMWIAVIYVCFLALGLKLPFEAAVFLMVVLNFGLVIPSSPGGLGVFEFMCILALTPFKVDKEIALGVGLTFHMVPYLITCVLGCFFAFQMNLTMDSLRKIENSGETCGS